MQNRNDYKLKMERGTLFIKKEIKFQKSKNLDLGFRKLVQSTRARNYLYELFMTKNYNMYHKFHKIPFHKEATYLN